MIEAPVTVPETSAFKPLVIIAVEAHWTVLRPLDIEAPVTVPEASAFRLLVSTAAETLLIEAPIDIAVDDYQSSNMWHTIGFSCRARMSTATMRIDWDVVHTA